MHRSIDNSPRHVSGWDTTSDDYLEHVSRIAKTLSIDPNVPRYPNVYRAFKNEPVLDEVRSGAPLGQYQNDLPQERVDPASVPVFYEVRNGVLLGQYQNDLPQQKVKAVSEPDHKKNEARGRSAEFEADDDGQRRGSFAWANGRSTNGSNRHPNALVFTQE